MTNPKIPLLILLLLFSTLYSCDNPSSAVEKQKTDKVVVVNSYPHDTSAFTQGLIFHEGKLYESTGLYKKSTLRKVDLDTGKVEKLHKLPDNYFAEGITLLDGKIYQLTWRSKTGIIYNEEDFKEIGTFSYPFEGWGITSNGKELIISNGSPFIYFYDPETFKQLRKIKVKDKGEQVSLINELEYIDGKIYANIWRSNKIIAIDPASGNVLEWYDLSGLQKLFGGNFKIDVLNGIAYDKQTGRIFVTGKLWPKLFEIKLN